MKHIEIVNCLEECGVSMNRETSTGTFIGRKIRVNCNNTVDIGDDNFDRWANSITVNFNPKKKVFKRQFMQACADSVKGLT